MKFRFEGRSIVAMALWSIRKINTRILELKAILSDENRAHDIHAGLTRAAAESILAEKNRPLLRELDELETRRKFLLDNRTTVIGVLSMLISLLIAFGVPILQDESKRNADIQSIYQSISANGDIFINNFNELKIAQNAGNNLNLPESFIEMPIESDVQKIIQREFGIDLYRYFLFYLNQTRILNNQVSNLHGEMIQRGSISSSMNAPQVKAYQSILETLESGDWETSKFNYIHDTACLEYIFINSFDFLQVAERDEAVTCSTESLNRIFYHYGYIEVEMPKWIRPELRAALNERESGIGDRLIGD